MRAYGRNRLDYGCCPGHDTYPQGSYNSRRSKKKFRQLTKEGHRRGRRRDRHVLRNDLANVQMDG